MICQQASTPRHVSLGSVIWFCGCCGAKIEWPGKLQPFECSPQYRERTLYGYWVSKSVRESRNASYHADNYLEKYDFN